MKYNKLTTNQLIHLAQLRLSNEPDFLNMKNLKITVFTKFKMFDDIVEYKLKSDNFADHIFVICFNKFYPNEFLYLMNECKINFN